MGIAKAWVNFLGSTGAIQSSFNVSSVTRNAISDYTINFGVAFSDANYVAAGMGASGNQRNLAFYNGTLNTGNSTSGLTASSCRIAFVSTGVYDSDPSTVVFFHA